MVRREIQEYTEPSVNHLRKFGALVLMLGSLVAPTMACAIPDSPMTSEERACCQMMKGQCREAGMPGSRGCCNRIPGSVYDQALNAKAAVVHPVKVLVIWLPAHELGIPASSLRGWVEGRDYSPRKSPPSTISILRI